MSSAETTERGSFTVRWARVSFAPGWIDVSGRLTGPQEADELIRALEALKSLLPEENTSETPGEGG